MKYKIQQKALRIILTNLTKLQNYKHIKRQIYMNQHPNNHNNQDRNSPNRNPIFQISQGMQRQHSTNNQHIGQAVQMPAQIRPFQPQASYGNNNYAQYSGMPHAEYNYQQAQQIHQSQQRYQPMNQYQQMQQFHGQTQQHLTPGYSQIQKNYEQKMQAYQNNQFNTSDKNMGVIEQANYIPQPQRADQFLSHNQQPHFSYQSQGNRFAQNQSLHSGFRNQWVQAHNSGFQSMQGFQPKESFRPQNTSHYQQQQKDFSKQPPPKKQKTSALHELMDVYETHSIKRDKTQVKDAPMREEPKLVQPPKEKKAKRKEVTQADLKNFEEPGKLADKLRLEAQNILDLELEDKQPAESLIDQLNSIDNNNGRITKQPNNQNQENTQNDDEVKPKEKKTRKPYKKRVKKDESAVTESKDINEKQDKPERGKRGPYKKKESADDSAPAKRSRGRPKKQTVEEPILAPNQIDLITELEACFVKEHNIYKNRSQTVIHKPQSSTFIVNKDESESPAISQSDAFSVNKSKKALSDKKESSQHNQLPVQLSNISKRPSSKKEPSVNSIKPSQKSSNKKSSAFEPEIQQASSKSNSQERLDRNFNNINNEIISAVLEKDDEDMSNKSISQISLNSANLKDQEQKVVQQNEHTIPKINTFLTNEAKPQSECSDQASPSISKVNNSALAQSFQQESSNNVKKEKAPRKKRSAPKVASRKPNFTRAFRVKNAKILPRDACDQFLKLNTQTIQWQQANTVLQPNFGTLQTQASKKSFIMSTFIDVGTKQKVYLIDSVWLNNLRFYVTKLSQIYQKIEQTEYELAQAQNQTTDIKNSTKKAQRSQKKQQSGKQDCNSQDLQASLLTQAKDFHEKTEYLDNYNLISPQTFTTVGKNPQEADKKFITACQDQQSSPLNVFLRPVNLQSCYFQLQYFQENEARDDHIQKISFQKNFDVIMPEFHEWLTSNQNWFNTCYLGIDKDNYREIPRFYVKDEKTIRYSLEMNFLQVSFTLDGEEKIFQVQKQCSMHDLRQRIQKFVDKVVVVSNYRILLKENGKGKGKLREISSHFNEKDILLSQFVDVDEIIASDTQVFIELKEKDQGQRDFDQAKILTVSCNYCRHSPSKNQTQSSIKNSMIACRCQRIFYCSLDCQMRDIKFHENKCLGKIETIEDWIPLQNKNEREWIEKGIFKYNKFRKRKGGLTGLQNLTNSCYMNCTLQCLSHCKALSNYFLRGDFIKEINNSNPLGAQGMIAVAYAKLIKEMWLGDSPIVIPINFKGILGRFKKQFATEEQQDSQELLNIVLDSLHEDLNRVKVKPLVPMIESHGEDDERASIESWEAHLKRSQSIIVDLMHGQFKSTVRCPEPDCNHLSITFEAFNQIILPIPEIKLITKQFVWVPIDIEKRVSVHKFTIKGHESIQNLRKYLVSEVLAIQDLCHDENGFEIVQIESDQIHRIMCYQNFALGLQNNDLHLFLYEIPPKSLPSKQPLIKMENIKSNEHLSSDEVNISIKNEIEKRVRPHSILSFLNIEVIDYQSAQTALTQDSIGQISKTKRDLLKCHLSKKDTYFPRLTHFSLDNSLIQIHLEIFNQLKYMFTRFLELRDVLLFGNESGQKQNSNPNSIEEKLFEKKLSMKIPSKLTIEKWNQMSLSEQYETVFSTQNYSQVAVNGTCPLNTLLSKNKYSSSQQSFQDPSRQKPQEIPYFVRIVSRKAVRHQNRFFNSSSDENESRNSNHSHGNVENKSVVKKQKSQNQGNISKKLGEQRQDGHFIKCIYCLRKQCDEGCPLPFEDRVTLRDFLTRSKAPLQSTFYFKDDDEINKKKGTKSASKSKVVKESPQSQQQSKQKASTQKKNQKASSTKKSGSKSKGNDKESGKADDVCEPSEEDENLEFQVVVQFNKNSCWGLYELLVRGQNQRQTFMSQIQHKKQQMSQLSQNEGQVPNQFSMSTQQFFIDKVTIADCFRQFNRPEKLSQQNEWYCDKCKQHKQALKKIQVYKVPPILIITLKRFKGQHTSVKQNTPVHYPIEDLNMKNFMIRNKELKESLGQKGDEQFTKYQEVMNDHIYDLFAVVLHTGTLNGGHYTALVKNNSNWYEFNDHQVFLLAKHETSKVISNHAYILFYQKRGIDFENIENYQKIRNALTSLNNGANKVEKFQGDQIRFPLISERKEDGNQEDEEPEDYQKKCEIIQAKEQADILDEKEHHKIHVEESQEKEIPVEVDKKKILKKRIRREDFQADKNQGQLLDGDLEDETFQEINHQDSSQSSSSSSGSESLKNLIVRLNFERPAPIFKIIHGKTTLKKRDKKLMVKFPLRKSVPNNESSIDSLEELLRSDEILQYPEIQEMNKRRLVESDSQIAQDLLFVKIAMQQNSTVSNQKLPR